MNKADWDNLDRSMERLKMHAEEIKEARIKAGLPTEPPANFVPDYVVAYIYKNTDVKQLYAFLVKLAKVTLDSGQVPPINPEDVLKKIPYYELLSHADAIDAVHLAWAASLFTNYKTDREPEDFARRLHFVISLLRDDYGAYVNFDHYGKELPEPTEEELQDLLAKAREATKTIEREREILKGVMTDE
ncbi:MAG: hypothetical protein ACK4HV_00300 [Parachlamydiaceae bacterium]